jgi:enoyl-[acyl-carrier protein] reductase I
MITMQNLFHDGGFSFTGVSQGLVEDLYQVVSKEEANS